MLMISRFLRVIHVSHVQVAVQSPLPEVGMLPVTKGLTRVLVDQIGQQSGEMFVVPASAFVRPLSLMCNARIMKLHSVLGVSF